MTAYDAPPMDDVRTAEEVEQIFFELRRVIVGQSRLLERLLVALLSRGHCLLESVPGLAKTLAAETLSRVVGGSFARIQFTPDLLPSDIVGTRIYRGSSERFDVELGPVFVNFLLTDEINRAPAKVQSALLEVMGEGQVTIGGITHQVPKPFFVVATQNPIESEGVYQLPGRAARPLHDEGGARAPERRRGDGDPRPHGDQPPRSRSRSSTSGASSRSSSAATRLRRPHRRPVRRRPRPGHPPAGRIPPGRHRAVDRPRRQPSGDAGLVRGARALALDPRPHVRHAAGRVRHRPRGAPPPPAAHLRRAGARHRGRRPDQPDPRHRAGHVGVAEAQRVAHGRPAISRGRAAGDEKARTLFNQRCAGPVNWPDGPPTDRSCRARPRAGDHDRAARRRRAARELPGHHAGARQRAGRIAGLPAGRRRAAHRLERHCPHPGDVRARPDRRPRPRGVARRRRVGGDAVRHDQDGEGPGRARCRRVRRVPHRAQQEPHRGGARRRPAHQGDAAACRARPGAGDPHQHRARRPRPSISAAATWPVRSTASRG